jgi:hypothetical protein
MGDPGRPGTLNSGFDIAAALVFTPRFCRGARKAQRLSRF